MISIYKQGLNSNQGYENWITMRINSPWMVKFPVSTVVFWKRCRCYFFLESLYNEKFLGYYKITMILNYIFVMIFSLNKKIKIKLKVCNINRYSVAHVYLFHIYFILLLGLNILYLNILNEIRDSLMWEGKESFYTKCAHFVL